jgi:O-antigen/teichoic acid export membrane protein
LISTTELLSSKVLARNTIWSFLGLASPLLVAFFLIPLLIESFGKERFGLLTIIWMGVGYFSLFDMGLSRALTKLVADQLGKNQISDFGPLVWSALWLILMLGTIGSIILLFSAQSLVHHVFNVGIEIRAEGAHALMVLALGLPFVVATSALIGLLEAAQNFSIITKIRVPLGIATFLAPYITSLFTPSITWATLALLTARLLAFCIYFYYASSVYSVLLRPQIFSKRETHSLLKYGGWITVSNIIGPLMVYFDRFFIGSMLNMTAVTYYATTSEVLSRIQIIPRSIMTVLFPAFATAKKSDNERLFFLYDRGNIIVAVIMLLMMSVIFLFAPEILQLWLGDEFRFHAATVLQILAFGWLINSLARLPLTVLQSSGYPGLVAKAHMFELVPYVILLYFLTLKIGIVGTAIAWLIRVFFDTIILNWLALRTHQELSPLIYRTFYWIGIITIIFIFAAGLHSSQWRIVFLISELVIILILLRRNLVAIHTSFFSINK